MKLPNPFAGLLFTASRTTVFLLLLINTLPTPTPPPDLSTSNNFLSIPNDENELQTVRISRILYTGLYDNELLLIGVYWMPTSPIPILFRVLNLLAAFLLQNSHDLKLFLHILHISSLNKRFDGGTLLLLTFVELHVWWPPVCEHNLHVDEVHCDAVEFSECVDDDCSMMGGSNCFRRG